MTRLLQSNVSQDKQAKEFGSDQLWDLRNRGFRTSIHTQTATTDTPKVMYDIPNVISAQGRTAE